MTDQNALIAALALDLRDIVARFEMCARLSGSGEDFIRSVTERHKQTLARTDKYLKGQTDDPVGRSHD